ncbi:predicted protein [Sclerotinia sclerotiorum 1980 UF-70]|uniref:Uncharacterized protein n=1 Tax=Sclerotinia sclerotiorum (strain ATCC 18683 / 1980 / Ss-1) TaxID=665079 RepID=A7E581_SCLS1|nr:predicted protein [Sclerotinia sclerotiorum 1980 UF-70]EDN91053.1 predicted protein [Sclerotinia sclerotiorum 1980 UF-70]
MSWSEAVSKVQPDNESSICKLVSLSKTFKGEFPAQREARDR